LFVLLLIVAMFSFVSISQVIGWKCWVFCIIQGMRSCWKSSIGCWTWCLLPKFEVNLYYWSQMAAAVDTEAEF